MGFRIVVLLCTHRLGNIPQQDEVSKFLKGIIIANILEQSDNKVPVSVTNYHYFLPRPRLKGTRTTCH